MRKTQLEDYRKKIDDYLEKSLPPTSKEPEILHKAMRYSVFSGGKRLRPIIVLAVGDITGVEHKQLLPVACGLELIHNFSLIHDDLPSMDNDDYRRGKLTCHKKFGEPIAILAGDALLTLAFEILAESDNCSLIKAVANATGSVGMAGGQVFDMCNKDLQVSDCFKRKINNWKTGKLFQICFEAPLYFNEIPEEDKHTITRISQYFGEAFQLRDDIEDKEGNITNMKKETETLYKKMKEELVYFKEKGGLLNYINEKLFEVE
ncbi:polyprenyl synthetase family protein [bacterium]|nr:polyprenyl synthetase family protein [bacterium]